MKTSGLSIQEAIRAVREGKATGMRSEVTGIGVHAFETAISLDFRITELLGTWELTNPVITPSPGEVWRRGGVECYILDGCRRIWPDGGTVNMKKDDSPQDQMIHGQNDWTKVYDPKEPKCPS